MSVTRKSTFRRWYIAGICWGIIVGMVGEMCLVMMGRSDPETTAIRAILSTGIMSGLLALIVAPIGIGLWLAASRRIPALESGTAFRLAGLSLLTICLNGLPFIVLLVILQDGADRSVQGYVREASHNAGGLLVSTLMLGAAILLPRLSVKELKGPLLSS